MSDYQISSVNIFQDLGYANAEEKFAKVKLASAINNILEKRKLSSEKITALLNLSLEKVTDLQTGRLKDFSLEELFHFISILGQDIEIIIIPKSEVYSSPKIKVLYSIS